MTDELLASENRKNFRKNDSRESPENNVTRRLRGVFIFSRTSVFNVINLLLGHSREFLFHVIRRVNMYTWANT